VERYLIKQGLKRLILLPIVLSVLYAGLLLWQLNRMVGEGDWVAHTTQVMSLSSDAQRHVQFQESALRGFLLTKAPLFEHQFVREDTVIDSVFQRLHQLALDNRLQTRRLDTILQGYWYWQASARRRLAVSKRTDSTDGRDSAVLHGAVMMESMRFMFHRFNQEEQTLYNERIERFRTGTFWLILSIAGLSILIGGLVGLYARRQARRFIDRFTATLDESSTSRELLETTLLSIGDGIIVTDASSRITLMNVRAEELTGWSLNEARNRPIGDVFRVVDEATGLGAANPVELALREHRPVVLPLRTLLLSRTGVDYPIEESAAPIHNSRNATVGAVLVFRDVTEQRENERQVQAREREFRALIENAPDVITRYARDLTIIYANPAIEQVLGIAPQALVGKHFKDVGIPDDLYQPWEQTVREVFTSGRSSTTEVQYMTVRGLRFYHVRLVPERDEHNIHSVIAISRDITDIKQTEERLRESEQRFRSIVDSSPDAFFMVRAIREQRRIVNFVFEYINSHGAELITSPADKALGKKLTDVFPGERPKEFISKYAAVIESGTSLSEDYHVETTYVRKAHWLHSQYVPIGDLLAVTTTDITERVERDWTLRQSEQRYRRLVENASEAIFSTDKEGRFTYANPYVRELGGYTTDDVTQYYFEDLVVPAHRERVKRHFFRQFISKTPVSYIEAPFRTKEGGEKWLAVTTSLQFRGDLVDGFDCIAIDISDKKRIEVELREAREHEGRVTEEIDVLRHKVEGPISKMVSLARAIAMGSSKLEVEPLLHQILVAAEKAHAALTNNHKAS